MVADFLRFGENFMMFGAPGFPGHLGAPAKCRELVLTAPDNGAAMPWFELQEGHRLWFRLFWRRDWGRAWLPPQTRKAFMFAMALLIEVSALPIA
jgi:hypothetical protein